MEAILEFFRKIVDFIKRLFNKEETTGDTDISEVDRDDDHEVVCYYGCPNSKRVAKLQTESKIFEN